MISLGKTGLHVPHLGLGCMGLTWAYGNTNEADSIKVLHRAIELGINFWDTAEVYGPYTNEELIGKALKSISREKVIIATKFGFRITNENQITGVNSDPDHIRFSVENSLKRLGTDYIDLYYQHRLDPNVPIEDVMHVLSSLVKEGKIKHIGLSEVGVNIIKRAHAVHPIAALQSEYSLWERDIEDKILPALKNLGIGLVAYSPLGRGFLTGKIQGTEEFDKNDWRRENFPRIQKENIAHNLKLVEKVNAIAIKNQVAPSQVALAWMLRQGKNIVPIPGTKQIKYLEENAKSTTLVLPDSDWHDLDDFLKTFKPAGSRYLETGMKMINRD